MSSTTWEPVVDGTSCGDAGQICLTALCSWGCVIGPSVYESGALNPTDSCQSCQSSISRTGWNALADGTGCNGDGGEVCTGGSCQAGCFIGGTRYGPGVADPTNPCESCQPAVSTGDFTPVQDGTACLAPGAICTAGICTCGSGLTLCGASCLSCPYGCDGSACSTGTTGSPCTSDAQCVSGHCGQGDTPEVGQCVASCDALAGWGCGEAAGTGCCFGLVCNVDLGSCCQGAVGSCTYNDECCSGLCSGGVCACFGRAPATFNLCTADVDCCSGACGAGAEQAAFECSL